MSPVGCPMSAKETESPGGVQRRPIVLSVYKDGYHLPRSRIREPVPHGPDRFA